MCMDRMKLGIPSYSYLSFYPLSTQFFFLTFYFYFWQSFKAHNITCVTAFKAHVASENWNGLPSPQDPNIVYEYCFLVQLRMCLLFYIGILPPYLATASPYKDLLVCCYSYTIMEPSWDHGKFVVLMQLWCIHWLVTQATSNFLLTKLFFHYTYILDCKFIQ